MDPARVYANDGDANPAFWTVLPGGTHGAIVLALAADPAVQAAIKAKINNPNAADPRAFVIDHINRATVNCIGQKIVGQPLQPEQAQFTIYNLLAGSTASQIDDIIGAAANTALHNAFAAGKPGDIIALISRQTGRALFQACLEQIQDVNPASVLSHLEGALVKAATN